MLKEFKDKSEFSKEKKAFTTLLNDRQHPEHIIEYLGSYEQDKVCCIILEYADIGTLDDYFRKTQPPTAEEDIVCFYTSLFNLIKGLMRVHEVNVDLRG